MTDPMTTVTVEQLKPCPFCGDSAKQEACGPDDQVVCTNCNAGTARFYCEPPGRAAAAWNTRAIATLERENAALRDILGSIKWKSADRDNMEFSALITYSQMDKIRNALGGQP